jgi:CheY-like chemotaxis protein
MKPKILVIDDSSTALLLVETILRKLNITEIATARNGADGLKQALKDKPSLILMDVVMPEMDGFTACEAMRKAESLRDIPIILITSRGEPCNVERGYESGCNDYITKPVREKELKQIVESYLALECES